VPISAVAGADGGQLARGRRGRFPGTANVIAMQPDQRQHKFGLVCLDVEGCAPDDLVGDQVGALMLELPQRSGAGTVWFW
jgi:hypothetical protein